MLYSLDPLNILSDFRRNLDFTKTQIFNPADVFFEKSLRYNIYENTTDGSYLIELVVPGFSREEIEVVQEGELLKIRGQRENQEKDYKLVESGYRVRNFEKHFKLSRGSQVKSANLNNGILRIEICLPENEQRKKISIN